MYPQASIKEIWQALKEIAQEVLVSNGRTYGGGLYKLEPKELANIRIYDPPSPLLTIKDCQPELF